MSVQTQQLAIDGGTPVRTEPLPAPYLGTYVLGKEELELLTEVVESKCPFRAYGDGNPHMANDFEEEAKAYFGTKYALGTATGSGSFYCAMAAINVGPGDEVIIPSFGWFTDFEAPVMLGATPIFADIDRSLNMDPDDFERKITPRTKAVIVVHFQGATNDMDRVIQIARKHDIKVVEDCAQACGANYKGRRVGSLGDVSCFSFQQNKIMSAGDGGLLVTDDQIIFERAVRFHDLGFLRPSFKDQLGGEERIEPFCGGQWRMNEFTGAVALAQIRKLDSHIIDITRRLYWLVRKRLEAECPDIRYRAVGDVEGDAGISLYIDLGSSEAGEWFYHALTTEGIRVGPSSGAINLLHNPIVLNRKMAHDALPPFGPGQPGEHMTYAPEQCPNTDIIHKSLQAVAMCPAMTEKDADDVAEAIIKVWKNRPSSLFDCGA